MSTILDPIHPASPLQKQDMDLLKASDSFSLPPGLKLPPGLIDLEEAETDASEFSHILSLLEDDLSSRSRGSSHVCEEGTPHDTFNFDRDAKAFYPEANHWSCDDLPSTKDWPYIHDNTIPSSTGVSEWEDFPENHGVDAPPGLSWSPTKSGNEPRGNHSSMTCSWHESAKSVGTVSQDGHIFTKTCGGERFRTVREGLTQRLSSICMVFDRSLRCGGTHRYHYQILGGEVGPADGAGFVFDSKVRRNNIQRMRAVFLNQRGQICVRNQVQVNKLDVQLPPLQVGMWLSLCIDLDRLNFQFVVCDAHGQVSGMADVGLGKMVEGIWSSKSLRSGFFCAVLTKDISVSLA
jgi:hypothetical protein|eukprot:CAMPEP_0169090412 /NCGR_PEP_ID=MMETSP1015-20121227/15803_1 /TAXON_ID=342587 /ORGANISM="Karlodinium micrum, Strain CCMP2283" /LENGTH=348 /DNA_ID=CAMNT_0009150811 /DNA_START=59 /DNA_END=1105 /DNA_ORIENTATION=-